MECGTSRAYDDRTFPAHPASTGVECTSHGVDRVAPIANQPPLHGRRLAVQIIPAKMRNSVCLGRSPTLSALTSMSTLPSGRILGHVSVGGLAVRIVWLRHAFNLSAEGTEAFDG